MSKDRYRCPVCQKRVQTYVPSGGDGSAVYFIKHYNQEGKLCLGTRREAKEEHHAND